MGTTPLGAGDAVLVHAGVAIGREELARAVRRGEDGAGLGFDTVTLPGLDLAATVVHRGPMSRIVPSARALAHGIDGNGYRSAGYAR
ncbi:hypothetical protein [Streptomyces diastatochromogenes]|uniref:hypothetical protein n=2 Tax=Streptomyces TaxID=1883 RepID=UPI0039BFEC12